MSAFETTFIIKLHNFEAEIGNKLLFEATLVNFELQDALLN